MQSQAQAHFTRSHKGILRSFKRFQKRCARVMEDKDRLALMDQYVQFKKQNPDKVSVDTSLVNGKKYR